MRFLNWKKLERLIQVLEQRQGRLLSYEQLIKLIKPNS